MVKEILKRDGRTAEFKIDKIANAIFAAARACGGNDFGMANELASKVEQKINESSDTPTVEDVQDIVEKVLIKNGHTRTSKKYILYRDERTRKREMNTCLMKVYGDLTFKSSLESDIKRENANIDVDTAMGTMLKYGSEGAKQFYEMFILDKKHSDAHRSGDIHIHDLDFLTLTTTCCQIDLLKLFKNGFSTGHGFLREPNDIRSYSALACIAIQSNQNDQHGGQSVPNFDYSMAPGVAKSYFKIYRDNLAKALDMICSEQKSREIAVEIIEEIKKGHGGGPVLDSNNGYEDAQRDILSQRYGKDNEQKITEFVLRYSKEEIKKATYQAMEALVHNLNTMHSRAGAQIPFSSLNYGTDTSSEGRLVMESLLLATETGLGNGETPIFPIQIFKVKEGINYNPGDPNYDLFKLSCRVTAKRLFPNFSFIDAPFNLKYYKEGRPETEVAYMGCRTRVIGNAHDPKREIVTGRGNLSFTSINLPRIAIRSHSDIDFFFEELDRKMDMAIDQINHRFKIQCAKKVRNYSFLMGQGVWIDSEKLGPDDDLSEVLKNGTLSIGFIGLAECLKALIGKHHGESQDAQNLGLEIISHMRQRLDKETEKTKLNYSLLATPAEGLSGRFVRLDKKRFGIIDGVTDKAYYTNSFHIPVYYNISAFEKIRKEAPYHELTNAGHITYVEVDGDPCNNIEALEQIVRFMKDSGIGYGSINHPVDRDPVCGYTGIIGDTCPKCGREEGDVKFDRIRRITGYLVGTLDRFNDAKRAEESQRTKHLVCDNYDG